MTADVVIVPTGTANTASVVAAFKRLGAEPLVTGDRAAVAVAGRVVLPGVGSFGSGVEAIDRLGLRDLLVRRIVNDEPTLAICLGFQLLAVSSDESPGARGLSVIPDDVTRIEQAPRVPHIGWELVEPAEDARFVDGGWAYFAHSYRVASEPEGWSAAWSHCGGPFVAAIERGNVLACQFHPELSGAWGANALRRWLDGTRRLL